MKFVLWAISILFLNFVYADPTQIKGEIIQAVIEGDANRLSSLLALNSVGVNFVDSHKNSLLHYAVIIGDVEVAGILVDRGAKLSVEDKFGQTALDVARSLGNPQMISVLESAVQNISSSEHSSQGVHLKRFQEPERTKKALGQAVANTHEPNLNEVVSLLSRGGDQFVNDVFSEGEGRYQLLHKTIRMYTVYQESLNKNLNSTLEEDEKQKLYRFVKVYKKLIEILIDFGADLNAIEPVTQQTPLVEAIKGNQFDIIALLLEKGADPNQSPVRSADSSPLALALDRSNFRLALLLLSHGADINFQYKGGRYEYILEALLFSNSIVHFPVVLFALKHGADPNKARALRYAVDTKNIQLTQILLDHGANPLLPYFQSDGKTRILEQAHAISSPGVIRLLEFAVVAQRRGVPLRTVVRDVEAIQNGCRRRVREL